MKEAPRPARRGTSPSWSPRRLLGVGVKVAVAAAFGFATLEVAFRAYHAVHPVFLFPGPAYDRFRGAPFSPNFGFRLNSRGFKDVEFGAKAPGTFRIAFIGDSFVFGVVPYESLFVTLLEERLRRRAPSVEVLNLGIVGLGVVEYQALLVREALDLEPDLVVVCFFVGNDFFPVNELAGETRSFVVSFFRTLFRVMPELRDAPVRSRATYADDRSTMSHRKYIEIESGVAELLRKDGPDIPDRAEWAATHLARMRDLAAARGSTLVVVVIPDEIQVDPRLRETVLARFHAVAAEVFDLRRPNRLLADALDRRGIARIDLLDAFLRESASRRLYKPQDTHWNIAGNALAAEVLEEELLRSGLLATAIP